MLKNKNFISIVILFFIATYLTWLFNHKLSANEVVFSGDQFFRFNAFETFINGLFIRKYEQLGLHNSWQLVTQSWDVFYYYVFYLFSSNMFVAQIIQIWITLTLTLFLSYAGFSKIASLVNIKINRLVILVITLWYSINPYTVSLWHGGAFNIGSSLTYSLAPLFIYFFHKSIFDKSPIRVTMICALLIFLASFTFWLFAPFVLLLIFYFVINLLLHHHEFKNHIIRLIRLMVIYLPLASFIIYNIVFEYFNSTGNNNSIFMPTFGNELGGLWYQILMLFSWGIYNVWTPRSSYPFYKFYFSNQYIIATLSLYGLIILGLLRKYVVSYFIPAFHSFSQNTKLPEFKRDSLDKIIGIFILFLAGSVFLAKAAQPPFGEIFLFLYNNVPFFSVFRTADIRFGFTAVLAVAVLLLLISRQFNKYIFVLVMILIIGMQNIYFLNGDAWYGQNIGNKFHDRIIHIPTDYQRIAKSIDTNNSFSYVLPLPSYEYGMYELGPNDFYTGQDLLPKITMHPFMHLSLSTGVYSKTYQKLDQAVIDKDYKTLSSFPIRFYLLRNDTSCPTCHVLTAQELDKNFNKVASNNTFTLYENDRVTPLINSTIPLEFMVVNPVTYSVRLKNVSLNTPLHFLMSFNKDWKLYLKKVNNEFNCINGRVIYSINISECVKPKIFFEGDELSYLWRNPLFENSHGLENGYANKWTIDPEYIKRNFSTSYYTVNKDGSINIDLVLYFVPQSWFYLTLLVSITSASGLIVLLVKYKGIKKVKIVKSNKGVNI
jgi:hypothetical protein